MPDAAWIGIVVTIGIFFLTHIVVTVWWASKIDTRLELFSKEFAVYKEKSMTKEEVNGALKIVQGDQLLVSELLKRDSKDLWKEIEEMKDRLISVERKVNA